MGMVIASKLSKEHVVPKPRVCESSHRHNHSVQSVRTFLTSTPVAPDMGHMCVYILQNGHKIAPCTSSPYLCFCTLSNTLSSRRYPQSLLKSFLATLHQSLVQRKSPPYRRCIPLLCSPSWSRLASQWPLPKPSTTFQLAPNKPVLRPLTPLGAPSQISRVSVARSLSSPH